MRAFFYFYPMFANRTLLIATQHGKEQVMAPLFEQALGVRALVNRQFDTDQLGTFSGEVPRRADPLSTLRQKCLQALALTPADLVVANEGSFGPHPEMPFLPADEEWMMWIDPQNSLEIVEKSNSLDTNFQAAEVGTLGELEAFAQRAKFPSHGLILRPAAHDYSLVFKGITDPSALRQHFELLRAHFPQVYVETDMRALFNPTRMRVIGQLAEKLLRKIQSSCPQCHTPGFDVTDALEGLPCNWCGRPTRSPLALVLQCHRCGWREEKKYPQQKTTEDPMFCDFCNP
jgi:hypothetical protein